MQPTRLSKSRSSKSPPYKSGTHCILLICIILILASSLSFFSEKEKSTSISEDWNPSSIVRENLTFRAKRIKHLSRDCQDKLFLLFCFTMQEILHKMLGTAIRWCKMEIHDQLKLWFTWNSDWGASSAVESHSVQHYMMKIPTVSGQGNSSQATQQGKLLV